ncbi:hypothetical protein X729_12935 [Mesorhizobium sp. L103C131B0]|nr:hypothetical protein X729_12935 [Mesorhizobium sp. L103C131B0]
MINETQGHSHRVTDTLKVWSTLFETAVPDHVVANAAGQAADANRKRYFGAGH